MARKSSKKASQNRKKALFLEFVEVPLVAIVGFRDGKLAHEHIYWDQASVLKQIGLLSDPLPPVFGAETARKVANPKFDSKVDGGA